MMTQNGSQGRDEETIVIKKSRWSIGNEYMKMKKCLQRNKSGNQQRRGCDRKMAMKKRLEKWDYINFDGKMAKGKPRRKCNEEETLMENWWGSDEEHKTSTKLCWRRNSDAKWWCSNGGDGTKTKNVRKKWQEWNSGERMAMKKWRLGNGNKAIAKNKGKQRNGEKEVATKMVTEKIQRRNDNEILAGGNGNPLFATEWERLPYGEELWERRV